MVGIFLHASIGQCTRGKLAVGCPLARLSAAERKQASGLGAQHTLHTPRCRHSAQDRAQGGLGRAERGLCLRLPSGECSV